MAPLARLCLIGPECTGKSTLAERLAGELGTSWSPEFAREYVLRVGRELTADDVPRIAAGQIANEDRAAATASGIVVLDTDLVSTVAYARHYYGACPEWIERAADARRADLYLLMDTDVPWQVDAARDSSRPHTLNAFRAVLEALACNWRVVGGRWDERWRAVLGSALALHASR
jgi:NadR type nicotinamide-nucleotide adenylyltransferase